MNKKTKKQIERTQQDIALLNGIIRRWEDNPLSQPSKAVETHLNNLRDKVQALENELGEPQVEIQYILGKINHCREQLRLSRMFGTLEDVHKWEAELAQWRAKLEEAQSKL